MSITVRSTFRHRIDRGDRLAGLFVKLPGRASLDLAKAAGFDFVVIDLEHSTLTDADALELCAHSSAIGLAPVVRLPAVEPGTINRLLEVGAAGIQLSTLRTAADALALRSATRHSPEGTRSVSLAHPMAGYGTTPLVDHLTAEAAAPPVLIGQFETATLDDPLADVIAPLDVAFLGTTDLSVDLGHPGQLGHPAVTRRIDEIATATSSHGTVLGAFANGAEQLPALLAAGARYLVVGSDIALLGRALADSGADIITVSSEEDPS